MKNTVELIGYYGSDEIIACSAWTSTSRQLTEEKRNRIGKLINMLYKEGHHTPFEKAQLHFLVDTDIASHIHLLKHRISSMNAECLEGNTLISFENNNGGISQKIPIKELYKKFNTGRKHQDTDKDRVYSRNRIKKMRLRVLNETTGIFEHSYIKNIWETEPKEIYRIKLRNGNYVDCSKNHRIYTKDGYKSINSGLHVGELVGLNGVNINIPDKPWTFKSYFDGSKNYTRKEFANLKGISYVICKKWGYIFDIEFKIDDKKDFKKGHKPWNSNITGYKIDTTNRKHNPLKGEESHFWGGGVTSQKRLNRKINNSRHIHYSDIISIEYLKTEKCYDIEVEGKFKNFVANGLVTHNSARYKELKEDKFYIPDDWCNIKANTKALTTGDKKSTWEELLEQYTQLGNKLYHDCLKDLEPVIGRKRAKESARFFKTYNSQIQADIMFNWRSFFNFQKLRNSDHAQKEIREIAQNMLQLVKDIEGNPFKHTIDAFEKTN